MAMDTSDQHQSSSSSSSVYHHSNGYHHGQSNGHKDTRSLLNKNQSKLISKSSSAAAAAALSSCKKSSSSSSAIKMCRSTSINGGPVITYGLRHEKVHQQEPSLASESMNGQHDSVNHGSKSLIFVKLTDSSLKAIEEYIKVISIPTSGGKDGTSMAHGTTSTDADNDNQKRFNFSISKATEMGPKGSFECIRHRTSSDGASDGDFNLINSSHSQNNKLDNKSRKGKTRNPGQNNRTSNPGAYLNSSDEEMDVEDWRTRERNSNGFDSDADSDLVNGNGGNKCDNYNYRSAIDNDRMMDILGQMNYKMTISATEDSFQSTRIKMSNVIEESKKNMTKVINQSGPKVGGRKSNGSSAAKGGHGYRKGIGHAPIAPMRNGAVGKNLNPGANSTIDSVSSAFKRNPRFNSSKSTHTGTSNHNVSSASSSTAAVATPTRNSGQKITPTPKSDPSSKWNNKRSNCDLNYPSSLLSSATDPSSKKVRSSLYPKVPSSATNVSPSMPMLISSNSSATLSSGPSPPIVISSSVLTPPPSVPSPTVPPSSSSRNNTRTSSSNGHYSLNVPFDPNNRTVSNSYAANSRHSSSNSHQPNNSNSSLSTAAASLNYKNTTNTTTSSALITKGYSDLIEGWANKPVSPVVVTVTAPDANGNNIANNGTPHNSMGMNGHSSQERTNGHGWSNGTKVMNSGHSSGNYSIKSPPSVDSIASTSSSQLSSVPSPEDESLISPPKKSNNNYRNMKVVKKQKVAPDGSRMVSSIEERNRLKKEFDELLPEYKSLQSVMDSVTRRFTKLEHELRKTPEGTRDWNRVMELILKEYDELKKDEKYRIQKKKHSELHSKLTELKKLILEFDQKNNNNSIRNDNSPGHGQAVPVKKGAVTMDAYKRMQNAANSSTNGHACGTNGYTNGHGCEGRSNNYNNESDSDGGHFLSDEDDDMNGQLTFGKPTVTVRNS